MVVNYAMNERLIGNIGNIYLFIYLFIYLL